MSIDFSNITSWIWIVAAVVILFIIFRFFFHIVVRVFHFVMSFFWHGCALVVGLLILYFILRAFHVF
ncbi:MAG TPA: hypothetical protein VMT73_01435 [Anaerolineales bacterium]|nr:hypothetical protein [Anaerolineales bacterium]